MNDFDITGNYYTINHVALFTGLSDRTLRNHIASGFLKGEKINNIWHFTPEQVDAYIRHPAVRPSILAKNNALVYDFLLNTKKTAQQSCVILDYPGCDINQLTEFFCSAINTDNSLDHFHFSFTNLDGVPRVILTGQTQQVLALVNRYYAECKK